MLAAALALLPAGAAAQPKLYRVSLSGDVRNDVTTVRDAAVTPPEGCVGSMTETSHFAASAGLAPKGGAAPAASYGRLRFRALLDLAEAPNRPRRRRAASRPTRTSRPPTRSRAAARRVGMSLPCRFAREATGRSGAEFVLLPNKGRYELYYNRNRPIVSCDDDIGESLLDVAHPKLTTLRVKAVKRLARGKTVSASGTATTAPQDTSATRRRDAALHAQGHARPEADGAAAAGGLRGQEAQEAQVPEGQGRDQGQAAHGRLPQAPRRPAGAARA